MRDFAEWAVATVLAIVIGLTLAEGKVGATIVAMASYNILMLVFALAHGVSNSRK